MLFWLMFACSFVISVAVAFIIPTNSTLAAFGLGSAVYIGLSILSIAAFIGLSMLLGKSDTFVLKKNRTYTIISMDNGLITIAGGETLPIDKVHNTVYCKTVSSPVLNVKQYNIGGWRRRWLYEAYSDRWEYTLYLPETN